MRAPLPANETARLQALRDYEILDSLGEQAFDDITMLATRICGVPIALISLVDAERQWFKARVGLQARQTPREHAFCAHAILRPSEVLVVADATADARFADNPLVTGDPGIRFYAGAPLVTPTGLPLGTVCVIDRQPRELTGEKIEALRALARQVVAQLELLRVARQLGVYGERLKLALDASRLAFFDWDLASDVVLLSEQWSDIAGGPAAETRTSMTALRRLVHPDDLSRVEHDARELLAGRTSYYGTEHRVRMQSGAWKWIMSRGQVVARDAAGRARRVTGTNVDISEKKQVEQLKDEFVATVSHELRTPLTGIVAALALMREGSAGELPPKAREFVELAYGNSERLTSLVNDILDLERLQSGRLEMDLEPVAIDPLLGKTLALNASYSERHGVSFALVSPASGLRVIGNPERLMQVLTNLLSNAAKHSPRGAAVTIEATPSTGGVRIAVIDHGPGIDPAFRPRLFGKFEQADSTRGGSGLGLAISKGLVERMGGRIGCESEPGRGSIFWLELPAA